jgi:hypothetical protein
MTVPGYSVVAALPALAFVVASGYASGRIHQWFRNGVQRDRAYREGYAKASDSLFDMAMVKRPETIIVSGRSTPVGALRRRISIGSGGKPDGTHGRNSAA